MRHIIALLLVLAACTPQERLVSTSTQDMPDASATSEVVLENGADYVLDARIVKKRIDGNDARMFSYNGQIPGPTLRVKQGSTVNVRFKNALDMPTTVHWHGIRLDNRFDGVPDVTQDPIKPGQTFDYTLRFPDPGVYWYHPHIREDVQQELGLYGAILVEPSNPDYYGVVDREHVVFLDDILLRNGQPELFSLEGANYVLMGRFGNTMFTNGDREYRMQGRTGETIRLYLINSANTRWFNFSIDDHLLTVIGGDSGLYERPFTADSVIIGPSERAIIEVRLERPGDFALRHDTPISHYVLGSIAVSGGTGDATTEEATEGTTENQAEGHALVVKDIDRIRPYFERKPDHVIDLTVDMHGMAMRHGMMMQDVEDIEWEDDMVMMNAMSTSDMTKWIIRDRASGAQNMDLRYKHKVGELVKLRFFNDAESMHPMQHVIHLHGQRFLVLSTEGVPNENLVWKDSFTIGTGDTVDVLVEVANPGEWMLHCHIAEHLEAGMMGTFEVEP